jgi:hypothetical protein
VALGEKKNFILMHESNWSDDVLQGFQNQKAVHLKDRSGKARSPASRLGGIHCGICGVKKFHSKSFLLKGLQFDPLSYNSTTVLYSSIIQGIDNGFVRGHTCTETKSQHHQNYKYLGSSNLTPKYSISIPPPCSWLESQSSDRSTRGVLSHTYHV